MKKIKFLMCVVIALSVFILPVTAFGATTNYQSGIRWNDICEDNNITLTSNYVMFQDLNGYSYIAFDSNNIHSYVNSNTIAGADKIYFDELNWLASWKVYKSNGTYNPYGTYTLVLDGYSTTPFTLKTVYANSQSINYERSSGEVVFQQVPLTTSTGTNLPTGPTSSSIYNGVLIEVISILPILLPVLIVFLAIRKGLAFTLGTLRTS